MTETCNTAVVGSGGQKAGDRHNMRRNGNWFLYYIGERIECMVRNFPPPFTFDFMQDLKSEGHAHELSCERLLLFFAPRKRLCGCIMEPPSSPLFI